MKVSFAKRVMIQDFQGEFVKKMLKSATSPDLIPFSGGIPNPISFPVEEMEKAAEAVLEKNGVLALQYSTAQGYLPLREFIAKRYEKKGTHVTAEDILITNGSQQALDIIAATLTDPQDDILVEDPSYLAALQTFHLYFPNIHTVELEQDGANIQELQSILKKHNPKFFYMIPDFQNPTGLTYTLEKREKVAQALKGTDTFLVEDSPYGELRFKGKQQPCLHSFLGEQCIMVGSFSKTISPGMRLGWILCTHKELREKMVEYKQLVDMHTNIFGQMILSEYLAHNDYDRHIEKIKELYRHQAETMIREMKAHFPSSVSYTDPEGGMFIWVTLPEGMTSIQLTQRAEKAGVLIAAGDPFYETKRNVRTFRLNYSNSSDEVIVKGIRILADEIRKMQEEK